MIYKTVVACLIATNGVFVATENLKDKSKVRNVIDQYSRELIAKKNIDRRGLGLECAGPDKIYDGKIHIIDVAYSLDKNLKYDEARKLFYEVADGLIDAINNHEEIGKYFYHYPIGYRDLEIGLAFDYESKGHLKKDDVDSIYIFENEVLYFIIDKEDAPNEIQQKQISPDISILQGFGSKTRCIRKSLPVKK